MTFAFINEAWGVNTDLKRKKKNIATCDMYKKVTKEPVTSKPAMLGQSDIYNVYPNDMYDNNASFVDYDDFYKSDFQYSSKVNDDHVPTSEHIPQAPLPVQESIYKEQRTFEPFVSNVANNSDLSKDQMYLEFILYVICGIFMILILEQVLQLGTKFVH